MPAGEMEALAVNASGDAVCVAGRNVFKVYTCRETNLTESHNLRDGIGRSATLLWVARDVAWSHCLDSKIATASTNGCVVLWDLHRNQKNKQESKFRLHERSVNKVVFHPTDPFTILSGSLDGFVRLLDYRTDGSDALGFESGTDAVRDVQFNFTTPHIFAAAYEAGDFKLWDVRRTDRPMHKEQAHQGPILSIDFHPVESGLLATAGRDRVIKVWSMHSQTTTQINYINHATSTVDPIPLYSIETAQSVRWRKSHEWQLASSSLVLDHSINVWDVRRPYIPFASFTQHVDVVTGMTWGTGDQLFSCGRDGSVFVNNIELHAEHPIDFVNPNALAVNVRNGSVMCSFPRERRPARSTDAPHQHDTNYKFGALMPSNLFEVKDMIEDVYVARAKNYLTNESSFKEMCEHNSRVCATQNDVGTACFWQMLPVIYADDCEFGNDEPKTVPDNQVHQSINVKSQSASRRPSLVAVDAPPVANAGKLKPSAVVAQSQHDFYFGLAEMLPVRQGEVGEEEGNSDSDRQTVISNREGEKDGTALRLQPLLQEPIQPKRLLVESPSPPPPADVGSSPDTTSPSARRPTISGAHSDVDDDRHVMRIVDVDARPFDMRPFVADQLRFMVDSQIDVQTAVTALLVLGDRAVNLIDEQTLQRWFMAYIDMLSRYALHTSIVHITSQCPLESVREMTSTNTSVRLCCANCKRLLQFENGKARQFKCSKCATDMTSCIVCQLPVMGRYVWCRGCSHGGHHKHIMDWFSTHELCPSGCGHACYEGVGGSAAPSRHTSGQPLLGR